MAKNKEKLLDLHTPMDPHLVETIQQIAGNLCPVLIVGERGVGKSAVSELIHTFSNQSDGEYKTLAAADIKQESLLAAIRGSGTLVLNEIANLPIEIQTALVRLYRESQSECNRRLICTTSYDLAESVRESSIREDFYYFISPISLRIPPLRYRGAELLMLAESMLERFSRQYDRPKPHLNGEMRTFLLKHTWPGNLPELEISMKTCVVIGDPDFSLAALRATTPGKNALNGHCDRIPLKEATRAASLRIERQMISEVLLATNWNRKQTAKDLKISYKTLLNKLKQNGIADGAASEKNGVRP